MSGIELILMLLSINTISVSPRKYYYDYDAVESSDSDSSESVESVVQARMESEDLRYLLLDRKCLAVKDRRLRSRYVSIWSHDNHRKAGRAKNCWVEMKDNGKIPEQLWNSKAGTKVLVHGYTPLLSHENRDERIDGQGIFKIGEEYRKENALVVDWTSLSASSSYNLSAYATGYVGKEVAEYIIKLYNQNSFISADSDFWKNLHLIGFSLGAHAAGVTGYQLQQIHSQKPGRITGLDPAGPWFDGPNGTMPEDQTKFLEKSDADFVDIMHCNMGRPRDWYEALFIGRFGSWVQAGHADFYPNGGEKQSYHCFNYQNIKACSHRVCVTYFINSIGLENYLACQCPSWNEYKHGKCPCKDKDENAAQMGEYCKTTTNGTYYLKVTE